MGSMFPICVKFQLFSGRKTAKYCTVKSGDCPMPENQEKNTE